MTTYLWEQTRALHHACEAHTVGSAMATGNPPEQWYADWLNALLTIHTKIDEHAASEICRVERLKKDLEQLVTPRQSLVAKQYADTLKTEQDIAGATYVLLGAHLRGGEVMRRKLDGNFPTLHLEWDDRKVAIAELLKIKDREDIVEEAKNCFYALLNVMNEIESSP
jgi:hypothetical protein